MDWAIEFDASESEAVKEYFVVLEFVRIFHVVTVIDVIFTTIKKIKNKFNNYHVVIGWD